MHANSLSITKLSEKKKAVVDEIKQKDCGCIDLCQ
jgi:hypothetical protein